MEIPQQTTPEAGSSQNAACFPLALAPSCPFAFKLVTRGKSEQGPSGEFLLWRHVAYAVCESEYLAKMQQQELGRVRERNSRC